MKNNIKFTAKIIIVAILSVYLLLTASALYKNGQTYKGSYSGIDKFKNVPENIKFANFGPSYGMNCFKYEHIKEMDKNSFNFSLTMQDFYHDYALYKTYEDNFSDAAVIAVPVSYFSFCSDISAPSGARYYTLLPQKYIKEYTLENYVSANYVPVYGKGNALVRDLLNDTLNSIMSNAVNSAPQETDTETSLADTDDKITELSKDSKTRIMTVETGNLTPYRKYTEENEKILINWIEEMKQKGFKPVLLLTPYWHEYANGFDKELLDYGFNQPLERVINKTGVPYVNFCSDEYSEYIRTSEYFSNCDHISKEGSKEFMKLYTEFLKENNWL